MQQKTAQRELPQGQSWGRWKRLMRSGLSAQLLWESKLLCHSLSLSAKGSCDGAAAAATQPGAPRMEDFLYRHEKVQHLPPPSLGNLIQYSCVCQK